MAPQAEIKVHDTEFLAAVDKAALTGLQQAAAFLHRELQKALRTNNRDGWFRSQPGEVPHRSSGGPSKDVFREVDEAKMEARLGVRGKSFHLFFMEVGTRAHTIAAKGGKMLRIPWRAEGRGERAPSEQEIEALGLVPDGDTTHRVYTDTKKGGRKRAHATRKSVGGWVFYRSFVNHPGTEKRPWMIPTLMASKAKLIQLLKQPMGAYATNFAIDSGVESGESEAA